MGSPPAVLALTLADPSGLAILQEVLGLETEANDGLTQKVTELSVLVLAELLLPATSRTVPAPMVGMIVPELVAVIRAVHVILSKVVRLETKAPNELPPTVISASINSTGLMASLKIMVKETGDVEVGSVCPPL